MAGLKIVLPLSFTDRSLPILVNDPLLSAGSLVLLDLTHPASKWTTAMPAASRSVPNIASPHLAKLSGLTEEDPSILGAYVRGNDWTSDHGTISRSARGGLHGAINQTASYGPYAYAGLELPAAAMAYILKNQDHAYYVSQWNKITKLEGAGYPAYGLIGSAVGDSGPMVMAWQQADRPGATSPSSLGSDSSGYPHLSLGTKLRSTAVTRATGTMTDTSVGRFGWGRLIPSLPGTGGASYTIYRQYVEDLTVSGRTYAQVNAQDKALYTAEVLTSGGRYYSDSV